MLQPSCQAPSRQRAWRPSRPCDRALLSFPDAGCRPDPATSNPAVAALWHKELRAVVDSPDTKQRLLGVGLEVLTSTPAEMTTRQTNLIAYMTSVMKAAGVEPE